MLKLDDFKIFDYGDYVKFRQLENPITSKNISIFEEVNIDTDLFENNTPYHDYVNEKYKEALVRINKRFPDFELFYYWDSKIRYYYETENSLPASLILYFKFSPETVAFLERMYRLNISGKVNIFLRDFRTRYFSAEIPKIRYETHIDDIIYQAILDKNIELIKKAYPRLKDEDKSFKFYDVSSIDNPELLEYLYTHHTIDDNDVNSSLVYSSEIGNLDNFKYLLSLKKYTSNDIDLALYGASRTGHLTILRLLLATNTFSDEGLEKALFEALRNGYIKVAEELINTGRIIGESAKRAYLRTIYSDEIKKILVIT